MEKILIERYVNKLTSEAFSKDPRNYYLLNMISDAQQWMMQSPMCVQMMKVS